MFCHRWECISITCKVSVSTNNKNYKHIAIYHQNVTAGHRSDTAVTGDRWNPLWPIMWKKFLCHAVIMRFGRNVFYSSHIDQTRDGVVYHQLEFSSAMTGINNISTYWTTDVNSWYEGPEQDNLIWIHCVSLFVKLMPGPYKKLSKTWKNPHDIYSDEVRLIWNKKIATMKRKDYTQ